jgi:hypothetical protein
MDPRPLYRLNLGAKCRIPDLAADLDSDAANETCLDFDLRTDIAFVLLLQTIYQILDHISA